jgi:L-aminopeptidase/D-esterase-like protein
VPEKQVVPANTTIAVVATDVALDKSALARVALMAQDGLARAIRPVHTPFDGDSVFALSTAGAGARAYAGPDVVRRVGALAADCLSRAVARGVYAAASIGPHQAYRDLYRAALAAAGPGRPQSPLRTKARKTTRQGTSS